MKRVGAGFEAFIRIRDRGLDPGVNLSIMRIAGFGIYEYQFNLLNPTDSAAEASRDIPLIRSPAQS
jgi:hypothetical protein